MMLLLLFACSGAIEKEECDLLCDDLVQTCEYGAYPTYESCLQGCAYQQSEGADTRGLQKCITKASCDTFAILECEHQFGADASQEEEDTSE